MTPGYEKCSTGIAKLLIYKNISKSQPAKPFYFA